MGSHAGLKKVVKSVKGKKGVVKRSYWVKAKEAVSGMAKRQGQRNAAAYKKSSAMGSAKTAARIGALSGLLGAHRTRHGSTASYIGAHAIAAGTRRATKTQGKTIWGKAKNFLGTELGHAGGHMAGAVAHEIGRAGIRAGVNAIRNRRKSA